MRYSTAVFVLNSGNRIVELHEQCYRTLRMNSNTTFVWHVTSLYVLFTQFQ
jgi:hypothetical protein